MQFLNKVVLVAAGVHIDKVVDVPVVMWRRSLHASSTQAFGGISPHSTCGAGFSGNKGHYFYEPLVLAVSRRFMRQSTEAFGIISQYFPMERWMVDSNLEVDSRPPGAVRTKKSGQYFFSSA